MADEDIPSLDEDDDSLDEFEIGIQNASSAKQTKQKHKQMSSFMPPSLACQGLNDNSSGEDEEA